MVAGLPRVLIVAFGRVGDGMVLKLVLICINVFICTALIENGIYRYHHVSFDSI